MPYVGNSFWPVKYNDIVDYFRIGSSWDPQPKRSGLITNSEYTNVTVMAEHLLYILGPFSWQHNQQQGIKHLIIMCCIGASQGILRFQPRIQRICKCQTKQTWFFERMQHGNLIQLWEMKINLGLMLKWYGLLEGSPNRKMSRLSLFRIRDRHWLQVSSWQVGHLCAQITLQSLTVSLRSFINMLLA